MDTYGGYVIEPHSNYLRGGELGYRKKVLPVILVLDQPFELVIRRAECVGKNLVEDYILLSLTFFLPFSLQIWRPSTCT